MGRIIFIPGIKGTELFNGDNNVWLPKSKRDLEFLRIENELEPKEPIGIFNAIVKKINIYQRVTEKLRNWFPGNIETFGYDWRKDAMENKTKLVDAIKDLYFKNQEEEKVTIVAHSMGGMIAKLAILELEEQGLHHMVDKLITIGTPWLGAPDALRVLIYGEHVIYRGTDTVTKFMNDSDMKEIARTYPSAYQLLPNQAYYDQIDGKYVRTLDKQEVDYQDIIAEVQTFFKGWDEETKTFKYINVWEEYVQPIHIAMLKPLPEEILHECIIGIEKPTLYGLSMESGVKRKEYKGEFTFKNGDGVVPLISAIPVDSSNLRKYYVKGEHGYLCSNEIVIELLEKLLVQDIKPLPTEVSTTEPENLELKKGKLAVIKCPVDSTILDNEGAYVAGVFDPSKEISTFVTEEKVDYFTIGDSKFIFIEENCEEDLNFDIKAYDEGITDVSLKVFEENQTIELDFASIPMTSKSSATFVLPLSDNDVIHKAEVLHEGEEIKRTIRTYDVEPIIIQDEIPVVKVEIKKANNEVQKKKFQPVYNGNIILDIKAADNTDVYSDGNIKEVMWIINDEPAKLYERAIELKNLKNGENIITVIGKDKFNRPLKSVTKKIFLDVLAPKTNLQLKAEPDGLKATFIPETYGTKATTKYRISYSWEEVRGEWNDVDNEKEIFIDWKKLGYEEETYLTIEYISKNDFGVSEESSKTIKVQLNEIPALMWSDASIANLTPQIILSNFLHETPNFTVEEIKAYSILSEKKRENHNEVGMEEAVKDNVKGVRFNAPHLQVDVMFAEPYSLYFSGPPSEVLKKDAVYKFRFELITERTKERISHTSPRALLRKNIKRPSNETRTPIILEENDGIFYGEFSVNATFTEDKHKIVITDNKNIDPPLRVITLIIDNDNVDPES
ncbi:lipase/acyltransferase domain-containing protein [Bacillus thuringiensis]|uniref:lipase/acyltransferase domain-containing protein n=1 Tax=Bacillus thuringiensis TaxID=1428 RepID=UPI0015964A48|nr:alpha/beta hydrolase [Bacillus thuringiensis]